MTSDAAEYKKVAADVRIEPEEFLFRVVQERTGNRKNPSIVTEVKDKAGKLIARYINGALEEGTKVQEVTLDAIVDKNNDVADNRVSWSIDDSDLFLLKKNVDEDADGYTAMSASVELNLQADFFKDIIEDLEKVALLSSKISHPFCLNYILRFLHRISHIQNNIYIIGYIVFQTRKKADNITMMLSA